MPRFDRTGPMGYGPGTGRGMGPCGRGMRRGFGRGFRGRGFVPQAMTREEEKQLLEEEQKDLLAEIDNVKKRLKELE
ncbi:DUF5320 domain-containing protein [Candidatus Woesearchaeota archaeon]|nr:DUF5320 domain-containing protein [Candidatus Woesearchaeota archaeon]